MSEAEKQESQKTVVAFISGLLIGGLLVWIFSASPEQAQSPANESDTEQSETTNEEVKGTNNTSSETTGTSKENASAVTERVEVGKGSLSVVDQKAGSVVEIAALTLPTETGWIVVRDDVNGAPGNTLGAARFSTTEGLLPKTVELLRATEAGKKYQVLFYTQEGDSSFKLGEDKLTTVPGAVFTAQ